MFRVFVDAFKAKGRMPYGILNAMLFHVTFSFSSAKSFTKSPCITSFFILSFQLVRVSSFIKAFVAFLALFRLISFSSLDSSFGGIINLFWLILLRKISSASNVVELSFSNLILFLFLKGPVLKSFMRQVVIIEDMLFLGSFGFYKMCLKSRNL